MTGEAWFTVLPDGDAGLTAARALRPLAARVVGHDSGRPWLLGSWPDGWVRTARAGTARLAVIGRCPVTADALAAGLGRVRRVEEAERAVHGLAGSFHVVASVGHRVRVRGSAAGTRRVFHTRMGGATIAADRSGTLARLTEAAVDERQLAVHLLASPPLHPLDDTCVWQGVRALRAHDCLLIEADGQARVQQWWRAPEPHVPAAEGAAAVRRALEAAVRSCTAGGGTISSDLSGGLDSTSLCFLAAREPAHLVTFRWDSRDPDNDDPAWASRAALRLPGAEHVVVGRADAPPWYDGVTDAVVPTEEPGTWVRDAARLQALARSMTGRGSRLHMMGVGGDELFTAFPSHLHDYLRSDPLAALGRLRRQRAFQRTPLWPVVRGLADRSTYDRWLAAWADGLAAAPPPARREPAAFSTDWGARQPMPSWATPAAVHAVRRRLRTAASAGTPPLAPQRGQHMAVLSVLAGGHGIRQLAHVMARHGLEYAAPFLDDGVVEAALAVRVAERLAPGRYKPVLAAAMLGAVPGDVLARSTKGEYSAEFHNGLRRNRAALLELFEDSRLARAGLIDATALRDRLLGVHPDPTALRDLDATVGCEVWLRSRPGPAPGGP
ncbi:asparagine synthase-related protein [Streptomyces luteireticuli]|uniref:asparagine synthase (glutamine-hydrolyzing) n=1 Tax=Streptomyces luteireticuli TaxID=173858 RepID=A0ABN0YX09_9ACTN